jgi:hypothetical protein
VRAFENWSNVQNESLKYWSVLLNTFRFLSVEDSEKFLLIRVLNETHVELFLWIL